MIRLYDAIRDIIATRNSYSIVYQDIEQSDTETIGLYILDGGDTLRTIDNKVTYRVNDIHIQVQSKRLGEINSPQDGFNVCKGIVESIENVIPGNYLGDIKVLSIIPQGGILFIGKNKENVPIFSINYKIRYVFKEEE